MTHDASFVTSAARLKGARMCGIVGTVGVGDKHLLRQMAERLRHRGPDGLGLWRNGDFGLAATRLSLVDEAHGAQPMGTDCGRFQLVFNGEIYNHVELRRQLERQGLCFRGRSDTEVILRGFAHRGEELFESLDGMYALAITDGAALYLARDPFGMKPLFYWLSEDRSRLVFASEIKAVLRCPAVPRALDTAGLVARATFGHTLGCRTLLQGVSHVSPGTLLRISRDDRGYLVLDQRPISRPPPPAPPADLEMAARQLADMLGDSVTRHRRSDHPVAAYLSGGIDSTILAAVTPKPERERLRTFVVSDDPSLEDVTLSRRVARHLGTEHHLIRVSPAEAVRRVPQAVLAAEDPRPPSLAFLSAASVRAHAKAAICGEGADELFAGYRQFREPEIRTSEYLRRLRWVLRSAELEPVAYEETVSALEDLLPGSGEEERGRRLQDLLRKQLLPNDHLVIWDRGTMAAGLETRMPFLSTAISDWTRGLPWDWLAGGGVAKQILRQVLRLLIPADLMAAVAARDKLAAPSALRITQRRLGRYALAAVPQRHLESHPFRAFFPRPASLLLFDLFFFAFIMHDGELPPRLSVERLYSRHLAELRECLAEALPQTAAQEPSPRPSPRPTLRTQPGRGRHRPPSTKGGR